MYIYTVSVRTIRYRRSIIFNTFVFDVSLEFMNFTCVQIAGGLIEKFPGVLDVNLLRVTMSKMLEKSGPLSRVPVMVFPKGDTCRDEIIEKVLKIVNIFLYTFSRLNTRRNTVALSRTIIF